MTGAVPAEIGQLTSLRVLYLNNNNLTSVPAEIGQLTSLQELNLNSNQLTSLPAALGRTHPRWGTPHVALLTQGVVVSLLMMAAVTESTIEEAAKSFAENARKSLQT